MFFNHGDDGDSSLETPERPSRKSGDFLVPTATTDVREDPSDPSLGRPRNIPGTSRSASPTVRHLVVCVYAVSSTRSSVFMEPGGDAGVLITAGILLVLIRASGLTGKRWSRNDRNPVCKRGNALNRQDPGRRKQTAVLAASPEIFCPISNNHPGNWAWKPLGS